MDDELIVLDSLDQSLPTDNKWALERIEEVIRKSVIEKDAHIALDVCKELVSVSKISGLALAKALYMIKENWDAYDLEETFEDIANVEIGLNAHTVDRYVKVWSMYETKIIPEKFEENIRQHNIKSQISIANALAQGYEITEDQWKELAYAPDFSTVSKIVREDIKGAEPRKGAIILTLDHIGTLWVLYGGSREFVGSLEVGSDKLIVSQAVERIIKGAGVLQQ